MPADRAWQERRAEGAGRGGIVNNRYVNQKRASALCLMASFALGGSAVITGAGCKKCKPAEAALSERAPDAAGGAGSFTSLSVVATWFGRLLPRRQYGIICAFESSGG